jgi:hypothetical protein
VSPERHAGEQVSRDLRRFRVFIHELRPPSDARARQSPRGVVAVAVSRVPARRARRARARRAESSSAFARARARRTAPTDELAYAISGNRIHASIDHSDASAPNARAMDGAQ